MADKILPLLVFPLGLAILFCMVAFIAWPRRGGRVLVLAAIALLWAASTPIAATWSVNLLERHYPPASIDDAETRDVAVVLGGGVARERLTATELGTTADRLFQAHQLWRKGKVRAIVVSGGNQPWDPSENTEAQLMAQTLEALDVPSAAIIVEEESRNTRENALNVREIWDERSFASGYLVTSASHMQRAEQAFVKVGLALTPWPADYVGGEASNTTVLDFLPEARALERTTAAIKEFVGLAVYRFRGWS